MRGRKNSRKEKTKKTQRQSGLNGKSRSSKQADRTEFFNTGARAIQSAFVTAGVAEHAKRDECDGTKEGWGRTDGGGAKGGGLSWP